ncbi:MAG: hypothetical protein J7K40_10460, partial [candidate division Zixibacteria bacterium]|nr:hypothetical protein [candidate division Zixibacteria bacterium]
ACRRPPVCGHGARYFYYPPGAPSPALSGGGIPFIKDAKLHMMIPTPALCGSGAPGLISQSDP